MTTEPLEELYFNWLYHQVASVLNPTPSLRFYRLLRELYTTEFVWIVSGDDNRAQDGLDVRKEFFHEEQLDMDTYWRHQPCSIIEMLIAFSRKAEFQTDLSARQWFWIFLENLGIADLSDSKSRIPEKTHEAIEPFIWRTYQPDGRGGLFPLEQPNEDQRHVELWYQLHAYLYEQQIF